MVSHSALKIQIDLDQFRYRQQVLIIQMRKFLLKI